MKTLKFILALLIMVFGGIATAQTIKKDSNGNFVQVVKYKQPDKPTGQTFTAKDGTIYIVYKSAANKLYVVRTSKKTGKQYRQYLPI